MKKKILIVVGIIFGVVLLAALLAPFFIDINHLKPIIKKKLEENLNATVTVGDLSLSVIKGIGIDVNGVTISNPPDFPQLENALTVQSIHIHLGTIQSLFGNPKITVSLEKPTLRVFRNQTGDINLLKLMKTTSTNPDTRAMAEPPEQTRSLKDDLPTGFLGALILKSKVYLDWRLGKLSFTTDTHQQLAISNSNMELGPLSVSDPIHIEFSGELEKTAIQAISAEGPFSFKGELSNPIKNKKTVSFQLSFDSKNMEIQSPWIDKHKGDPLQSRISGVYEANKLTLKSFKLSHLWGDVTMDGEINNFQAPQFKINVTTVFQHDQKESEEKQRLPINIHLSLKSSAEGSLKPFNIATGHGYLNLKHLQGTLPPHLKKKIPLPKLDWSGEGNFQGDFEFRIENNTPVEVTAKHALANLTAAEITYEKWVKKRDQQLIIDLSSNMKLQDGKMAITLEPSVIQFDRLRINANGGATLPKDKSASILHLNAATNSFPIERFSAYLPKLPFRFQGNIKVPQLVIRGNPYEPKKLDIRGQATTPRGTMSFNASYFKGKKWGAKGPITFAMDTSFHIQRSRVQSMDLSAEADFSNALITFENTFVKPSQKRLSLSLMTHMANNILTIKKSNLVFHNMKVSAKGSLQHVYSKKRKTLNLTLNAKPFSLSEWNAFFPNLKTPFWGSAEIKAMSLSVPMAKPKDLSMSGSFLFNQIKGEIPADLLRGKKTTLQGPFLVNLQSDIDVERQRIKKLNLNGDIDLSGMNIKLKDTFAKPAGVPFRVQVLTQSKGSKLTIQNLKLTLKSITAQLKGQADRIQTAPHFDVRLTTSSFSFDELKSFLPSMADQELSGNMRLNASLKGSPKSSKNPIYLTFRLNSTQLSYQSSDSDISGDKKKPKTLKKKSRKKETPIYKSPMFKRFIINGNLNITKAKFNAYKFWNMQAKAHMKNNLLKISPFKFQFYEGKFNSSTTVNFNRRYPATQFSTSLENFNIEKFLISQKSKAAGKLSGKVSANLNVNMSGLKGDRIKKTLSGRGTINIRNGHFKLFNLSEVLAGVPIIQRVAPGFDISDQFDIAKSSIIIQNQKLITPDIILRGKRHLLKSSGDIGFDGALDYKGIYYLSRDENPKKAIPFTVKGTVEKPEPAPDFEGLLQTTVHGVIEDILKPRDTKQPQPQEKKEKRIIEDILEGTIFK